MLQNLQIDPEKLPRLEQVDFKGHPTRYRTLRIINLTIFFLILLVLPVVFTVGGEFIYAGTTVAAWLIFYLFLLFAEYKSFPIRGYALRENDITYKKGWIFYSHTTIPFNRIQHTELAQGPVARLFKLTTLRIYTAGGASSDLSVSGIDNEEAQRLKDFIATASAEYDKQ